METVGELLRKARLSQGKSLKRAEKATNIPEKKLRALEKDNFSSLPSEPFIKGFIKIYADYLDLDPQKMVAIFRRDWKQEKEQKVIPGDFVQRWREKLLNPETAVIAGVFLVSSLFFLYIGLQLKNYLSAPDLTVSQPEQGAVVKKKQVQVKGKTNSQNTVYVNDQLINVNDAGEFSYTLKVLPGKKEIVVAAVNRRKQKKTITRTVEVVDN